MMRILVAVALAAAMLPGTAIGQTIPVDQLPRIFREVCTDGSASFPANSIISITDRSLPPIVRNYYKKVRDARYYQINSSKPAYLIVARPAHPAAYDYKEICAIIYPRADFGPAVKEIARRFHIENYPGSNSKVMSGSFYVSDLTYKISYQYLQAEDLMFNSFSGNRYTILQTSELSDEDRSDLKKSVDKIRHRSKASKPVANQ